MPPERESSSSFLTDSRVDRIGQISAALLCSPLSWIDRRKESIHLLDDTALRRQISVDFSLRRTNVPLIPRDTDGVSDALYAAPVLVLPKAPANLMAFDLVDESGASLFLIPREDNARISAATLVSMATTVLEGTSLMSATLQSDLRKVALADASDGQQIARRLLAGLSSTDGPALLRLARNDRFAWWLSTLAHSSLVVVLFRSPGPRRKMIKLTFEEPIRTEQRRLTRLGWAPYRVGIDSSLIEARSYHFEAQAPPGLRIIEARFTDDGHDATIADAGFLRRVHLYRPEAAQAGAGTAVLWLAVSGAGFTGGAFVASMLTLVALAACANEASSIAANPNSAPALLLLLPGLIATYVARPDQHALTTRLLSTARRVLMGAAALAYLAAAKVALAGGAPKTPEGIQDRADSLREFLVPLALLAIIPAATLAFSWFAARAGLSESWNKQRFSGNQLVPIPLHQALQHVSGPATPGLVPEGYELESQPGSGLYRFAKRTWHGTWFLTVELSESGDDTEIGLVGDYLSLVPGTPAVPWLVRREAGRVTTALDEFCGSAIPADD